MPPQASPFGDRPSFRPQPPGRGLLISRRTIAASAVVGALLTLWAGAATWYIVNRDDFAQSFLARQDELRFGYEDRIGELTRRLEREVTHGLLQKDTVEDRLRFLAGRQANVEARQTWLRAMVDRKADPAEFTGSVGGRASRTPPSFAGDGSLSDVPPPRAGVGKPQPLDLPSFGLRDGIAPQAEPDTAPAATPDRLGALEGRIDAAGADALRLVGTLASQERQRLGRLRAALDATGLPVERLSKVASAVGGPLVPLPAGAHGDAFGVLAAELEAARGESDRLRMAANVMPLGQPLPGELEMTSPFGFRMDPFTRTPALHTGADFRAEFGAAVRATAAGRVVSAEFTGGYGNMVEIDHGHGLSTRYGHLSAFAVTVGEQVAAGSVIGRAGSTGRSTGTHVHYETRINGEPVNPLRFLQAGRLLDAASAGSTAASGRSG